MLEKGLPDERGNPFLFNIIYIIGYNPTFCIIFYTVTGIKTAKLRLFVPYKVLYL